MAAASRHLTCGTGCAGYAGMHTSWPSPNRSSARKMRRPCRQPSTTLPQQEEHVGICTVLARPTWGLPCLLKHTVPEGCNTSQKESWWQLYQIPTVSAMAGSYQDHAEVVCTKAKSMLPNRQAKIMPGQSAQRPRACCPTVCRTWAAQQSAAPGLPNSAAPGLPNSAAPRLPNSVPHLGCPTVPHLNCPTVCRTWAPPRPWPGTQGRPVCHAPPPHWSPAQAHPAGAWCPPGGQR